MTDDPVTATDPTRELERAYIAEFLARHGQTLDSLRKLSEPAAHDLLKAASIYASGKLTEVESRSHYVGEVHGGADAMAAHVPVPPVRKD